MREWLGVAAKLLAAAAIAAAAAAIAAAVAEDNPCPETSLTYQLPCCLAQKQYKENKSTPTTAQGSLNGSGEGSIKIRAIPLPRRMFLLFSLRKRLLNFEFPKHRSEIPLFSRCIPDAETWGRNIFRLFSSSGRFSTNLAVK